MEEERKCEHCGEPVYGWGGYLCLRCEPTTLELILATLIGTVLGTALSVI